MLVTGVAYWELDQVVMLTRYTSMHMILRSTCRICIVRLSNPEGGLGMLHAKPDEYILHTRNISNSCKANFVRLIHMHQACSNKIVLFWSANITNFYGQTHTTAGGFPREVRALVCV